MHGWEHLKDEDRDLILAGIEEGRALGGPFHVELDPIDVCNADCFFCNSAEIRQGAIFGWDRLGPIVDELVAGGLRSFRVAGGGEPLLYPQLGDLFDRMAAANVALDNLTTNGIRLIDRVIDHLLKVRMSYVFVSLNYATADRYGQFMRIPAARFGTVVDNIRRLDERLKAAGRRQETVIQTQFFIHRSTVDDLDDIMALVGELPVDTVAIRSVGLIPQEEVLRPEDIRRLLERLPAVADWGRGRWLEFHFGHEGIQAECDAMLRATGAMAPPGTPPGDGPAPGTFEHCFIGWYSMLVQGTGDVHACCFFLPDERVPAFGNLNRQSVAEVWNGELYVRHRREMRAAMLLGAPLPGAGRGPACTLSQCWAHNQCVLSHQLADRSFYMEAHRRLEELRARPLTRLARAGSDAARRAIGGLRAPRH